MLKLQKSNQAFILLDTPSQEVNNISNLKSNSNNKRLTGFTLLEILLVIGIISIIAGITIIAINPARQLAQVRNTERKSDIKQIDHALNQYYIDHGNYPDSLLGSLTEICDTGDATSTHSVDCDNLIDLSPLVPTYLTAIPKDPKTTTNTGAGYKIMKSENNNKIIVYATEAELNSNISLGTMTTDARLLGPWYNGSWSNRKKITIDHTKVGDGAESQVDFPVLISLSNLSNINASGTDIRFTSSDMVTELAREIEFYSNGTLFAWVKVPFLSYTSDTVIYMYYDNPLATEPASDSTYGSEAVWDDNYSVVYHMNRTSGPNLDSTNHGYNTVYPEAWTTPNYGINTNAISTVMGMIGQANHFDDNIGGWAMATGDIGKPELTPSSRISISAWAKADGDENVGSIYSRACNEAFGIFYNSSNGYEIYTYNGIVKNMTTVSLPSDEKYTWHYITQTYDGTDMKFYIDGQLESTTYIGGNLSYYRYYAYKQSFMVGAYRCWDHDQSRFGGLIDEVRLSATNRSAGWIATEYNNQNSPEDFYEVTEE